MAKKAATTEASVSTSPCTACHEITGVADYRRARCSHVYCRACTMHSTVLSNIIAPGSQGSPRCCGIGMPLRVAILFLTRQQRQAFEKHTVKWPTPNRTHWSRETCSAYISPANLSGDVGTCPSGQHQTCTMCKQASHTGGDGPKDLTLQSMLTFATGKGGKDALDAIRWSRNELATRT